MEPDKTEVECPQCGDTYDYIGIHWSRGQCDFPELSQRQSEILTGLLMGDGWVDEPHGSNTHHVANVVMVSEVFLEWVDQEVGWLTTGVKDYRTSKECADISGGKEENYRNQYHLRTRSVPAISRFRDWYKSGSKRFPEQLTLTPTIAKMWYCCDGHLHWPRRHKGTNSSGVVHFGVSNESDRKQYIVELFDEVGFDVTWDGESVRMSTEESSRFLEWTGVSPPGFGYKWARTHEKYKRLKNGT